MLHYHLLVIHLNLKNHLHLNLRNIFCKILKYIFFIIFLYIYSIWAFLEGWGAWNGLNKFRGMAHLSSRLAVGPCQAAKFKLNFELYLQHVRSYAPSSCFADAENTFQDTQWPCELFIIMNNWYLVASTAKNRFRPTMSCHPKRPPVDYPCCFGKICIGCNNNHMEQMQKKHSICRISFLQFATEITNKWSKSQRLKQKS